MSDTKMIGFELRMEVVAVVQEPQREDPPGRDPMQTRYITLAQHKRIVRENEVDAVIKTVTEGKL